MRLSKVNVYEVVVPAIEGRVQSDVYGPAGFDIAPRYILEAHTDVGIVGLGESHRNPSEARLLNAIGRLKGVDLKDVCLQDPPIVDVTANNRFINRGEGSRLFEYAYSSIEDIAIHVLLFDLVGKFAGMPMCNLLGGAYRRQIRVDAWMGRMTPEDSARIAREAQCNGYKGIKLKCMLEDDVIKRAEAIRDACGVEFKLTLDPNRRFYRPAEALSVLKELANVGNVECLEDPFLKGNLEWYRLLREQGLFSVALHQCNGLDLMQAIREHACDYVNLEGTPWDVRKAGDVCWAAGIATWHYSGVDLGILEAAYLHTCAATKSMSRPSDILGRSVRGHNLINAEFQPTDGWVGLPVGNGLGVELDRDALDRHTVRRFSIDLEKKTSLHPIASRSSGESLQPSRACI